MISLPQKGDERILRELETARFRNRSNDNPNLHKPRMVFDFNHNRVCIDREEACTPS